MLNISIVLLFRLSALIYSPCNHIVEMRTMYYLPTRNKLLFEFQFCIELSNFISDRQSDRITHRIYICAHPPSKFLDPPMNLTYRQSVLARINECSYTLKLFDKVPINLQTYLLALTVLSSETRRLYSELLLIVCDLLE